MQKFKFPMEYLRVTQGENVGSHLGTLAMDFGGKDTGSDKLYCPCDMVVVRTREKANGELYLESTEPVLFADGTSDYARLLCIHDSTFNVSKGQIVKQGEYFYDEGGMGSGNPNAFAIHVHIEAGKGKFTSERTATQSKNSQGTYAMSRLSHLNDLFVVGDDVVVLGTGGYDWVRESELDGKIKAASDNTIYGVDLSHNRSADILKKIVKYGKADFVIPRVAVGSDSEDKNLLKYIEDRENLKIGFFSANYFGSVDDAIEEADYLMKIIEKYGFTPEIVDLPIFCDWEYFSYNYQKSIGKTITPAQLQEMTVAYCNRIMSRGYKAGVYLNKDFWDNWYGADFFKKHPELYIWYARPGYTSPDRDCYLWQYARNNGSDFGAGNEDLDKNILMGSYIEEIQPVEPMKPLSGEPVRMKIGYASAGDIKALQALIEGLGIACDVKDGYIITGKASSGDQCYIIVKCKELGIPYSIYEEKVEQEKPVEPEQPTVPETPKEQEVTPEQPKEDIAPEAPKTPEIEDLPPDKETKPPEVEKPAVDGTEGKRKGVTINNNDNWLVKLIKLIIKAFFE